MKLIQTKDELIKTVEYIAEQSSKMAQRIIGRTFPIRSLTVFSHSQGEFDFLCKTLQNIGKTYNYNNGPRVELFKPIEAGKNKITHLRIRKPDLERPQVGYNDFETDYETFKRKYLLEYPKHLALIVRPEYEMIELRCNEFDVLAYVVSRNL